MTGGTVVVLGVTGRNFAAGMSGGVAYVLDEGGGFSRLCNMQMVGLEPLNDKGGLGQHLQKSDVDIVCDMLKAHIQYTDSPKAKAVLADWQNSMKKFVKVMPHEYRRALMRQGAKDKAEAA